jgi:hypothetical protein
MAKALPRNDGGSIHLLRAVMGGELAAAVRPNLLRTDADQREADVTGPLF